VNTRSRSREARAAAVTACLLPLLATAAAMSTPAAHAQETPPPATPGVPQTPGVPAGQPAPVFVPPPAPTPPYVPFPHLPPVTLDETNNRYGIAQQVARANGLQARMLWIDATANLDRFNTAEKIKALVAQIKAAGFNTICFEAKPIIGQVTYPSKFAPKLTEWQKQGQPLRTLPADFDPLAVFAAETRAQGIGLVVNFNAFSEGHTLFLKGPGYDHPEWQTVLYEESLRVRAVPDAPVPPPGAPAAAPVSVAATHPLAPGVDELPEDAGALGLYRSTERVLADLPKRKPESAMVAVLDKNGRVVAQVLGTAFAALKPQVPEGGAALVGVDAAADFLRASATVGRTLTLEQTPNYVRIGQRPRRQVPLMTNPFREDVRRRLLDIVGEVVKNYPVDGVIFDDRLRYAGLDADFSDEAKRGFEAYIGRPVVWPYDVLRWRYAFPSLQRTLTPGPLYDAWLTYRALNLRNFVAEVQRAVKAVRPEVTVATYVGSWYPDYPDVGANWAADDFRAGLRFLDDSFRATGWAGLTDYVVTGCYYPTATIYDAVTRGMDIGATVEAAGQFSNRAVNDASWTYAGIALSDYKGKPEDLKRALQAAAATTQGIMVFDLSHDIEPFWPVFADVFRTPAVAPHARPEALADVRAQKAARKAQNLPEPPVILYRGKSGTGF